MLHAKLMPLDNPMIPAVVTIMDPGDEGAGADKNWVRGRGEWMAMIHGMDRWTLKNYYRQIELPQHPPDYYENKHCYKLSKWPKNTPTTPMHSIH